MKLNKKKLRILTLCVMLFLIIGVTVLFSFHIINLNPVYKSNSSSAVIGNKTIDTHLTKNTLTKDQSVVSVVQSTKAKAEDLQYADIQQMVDNAVSLAGGFDGVIKDGMTVVVKPNLVTPIDYTLPGSTGKPLNPEVNGTTTDYRVTKAVVALVRKYNPHGKVFVMEGSAFNTKQCMQQLLYTSQNIPGVDEFVAIEDDSGAWRDYNSPQLVKVPVKNPLLAGNNTIYMNKRYYDADVIISVPVLKTHWTEVVSGSVKNIAIGGTPATIYGASATNNVRSSVIDHDKTKLDEWIHDWFMANPAKFAIIDGLQGIQNGPTPSYDMTHTTDIRQDQMNTRLIVASRDCVAADTVESLIMEWNPAAVGYLGELSASGVGNSDISNIFINGKRVDQVRKNFKGTAPDGKFTDLTPPSVTVNSAQFSKGVLSINMSGDQKTQKVEVYSGGDYLGTYTPSDTSNFTIQAKGLSSLQINAGVTLQIYDQYLNFTEKKVEVKAS